MKRHSYVQVLSIILLLAAAHITKAEDGYDLWLRYKPLNSAAAKREYAAIKGYWFTGNSATVNITRQELSAGLKGMLGVAIPEVTALKAGVIIAGVYDKTPALSSLALTDRMNTLGDEGYLLLATTVNKQKVLVITANTDIGVLYGTFHFLRLLQTETSLANLHVASSPKIQVRMLNHWDNLDRTIERGYAGFSLWDWHKLPDYIDPRYIDYARANASIGINGVSLTNVNANALILTPMYLEKVKALADLFRPYGIKVYLTARFSAPIEIGKMKTADPLDPDVRNWWKKKVDEIYTYVPDFGGFVVKANSEGQPGPQDYKRSHGDGANMLAEALQPHHGIVMWRAFVYSNEAPDDRHKQAYNEFKSLDGTFLPNVLVQVKNGAIDFQPREPFHPLFGAMPKTHLMMEFQITQEYLGFATHLVYLATLFRECLDADTYAKGTGSTVAKVIDGTLDNHTLTGITGVANIGDDRNWCGHHFAQANWYAFGRLAWDHTQAADAIADDWLRMTFTNDQAVVSPLKKMMMESREATVNYMTPLGLHHIMGNGHHFGPGPWVNFGRADWTSTYYHRADSLGLGFNRTTTGSTATDQYFPPVAAKFNSRTECPEEFLLWFHHVGWDEKLKSGRTLWESLCDHYYKGVEQVAAMQKTWDQMQGKIDPERFSHVKMFLAIQHKEAVLWRNSCVLYFQSFSKRPIPPGYEKPDHDLSYYESLSFPYAPGIRPRW
jgi:alpha-glucuronidase